MTRFVHAVVETWNVQAIGSQFPAWQENVWIVVLNIGHKQEGRNYQKLMREGQILTEDLLKS